ncbi:hypothetical protein [Streptococcus pantholopis]|uniref:Uncharacterized protein n=1 Tax=Streptococcus pantholopis TaxID=1811193 RepID=A0A172Q5Q3_9STRE|nr:hypothetical protein [Streptococcus pantholopis]AND78778.1 hypothetical protein A0O21_01380 [Streptococcus pantholopis]
MAKVDKEKQKETDAKAAVLQAELLKEDQALLDMEQQHKKDQTALDERINDLEERHFKLRTLYEEFGGLAYSPSYPDGEGVQEFRRLLEEYAGVTANEYLYQRQILGDEEVDLTDSYQKEHRKQEDKIESLYAQKIALYREEEEEN